MDGGLSTKTLLPQNGGGSGGNKTETITLKAGEYNYRLGGKGTKAQGVDNLEESLKTELSNYLKNIINNGDYKEIINISEDSISNIIKKVDLSVNGQDGGDSTFSNITVTGGQGGGLVRGQAGQPGGNPGTSKKTQGEFNIEIGEIYSYIDLESEDINKKIQELEKISDNLNEKIEEYRKKIEEYENQIQDLNQRINELDEQISRCERLISLYTEKRNKASNIFEKNKYRLLIATYTSEKIGLEAEKKAITILQENPEYIENMKGILNDAIKGVQQRINEINEILESIRNQKEIQLEFEKAGLKFNIKTEYVRTEEGTIIDKYVYKLTISVKYNLYEAIGGTSSYPGGAGGGLDDGKGGYIYIKEINQ